MSESTIRDGLQSASASLKEEREREREVDEQGKLAMAGDIEAARERSIDKKLDLEPEEPFLVEWNGKDDPENPLNFKTRKTKLIICNKISNELKSN